MTIRIPLIFLAILQFKNFSVCQNPVKEIHELILKSKEVLNSDSSYNIILEAESKFNNVDIPDSLKALLFHRKGEVFSLRNLPNEADSLYRLSENIYRENNDNEKLASVLHSRGYINNILGNYSMANNILNEAWNLAERHDFVFVKGQIKYAYGQLYNVEGKYEESVKSCIESIEIFKQLGKTKNILMAKMQLSISYSKIDTKESLRILKEIIENPSIDSFPRTKLKVLSNIGVNYGMMNIPDTSLYYLQKAISLAKENNFKQSEIDLYGSIANAYTIQKKYGKALEYYEKEALFIPEDAKYSLAVNSLNKGMISSELGKYSDALHDLQTASSLARVLDNANFEQFTNKQLAITYSHIGDYKNAFELYRSASNKKDSIFAAKKIKQIQELEVQYSTAEKELENIKLTHEKEISESRLSQQKAFISVLCFGVLSLLWGLYVSWKKTKEKTKLAQELSIQNAKIESLNIETAHRTKNYLNLATSLLSKSKVNSDQVNVRNILEENAQRIKVLASVNQRLSSSNNENNINIKDFLSNLIDDLSFSFSNINNRELQITYDIENLKLDANTGLYLGLMINELIVNSIKHATVSEDLKIHLSLLQKEEDLYISYQDNGASTVLEKATSGGLSLIHDLFKQLNGTMRTSAVNGYELVGQIPYK